MFIFASLLNLFSSYLIASLFGNILVLFVVYFALIILNIEILSLFGAIEDKFILLFSLFNFVLSFVVFKKKKGVFIKPDFDFERFKNSLFLDKALLILSFSFLSLLCVTFLLGYIMPPLEPDSQTYHFIRAYQFYIQKSLNHFETNDVRALIMPINSEILYTWILSLKKTYNGYALTSYFAFLSCIFFIWNILEEFKFVFRKRIFAILIFASLSGVIVQITSLQTDILVGALLLAGFYFFIKFDTKLTYISALSVAIAMGVKSTAIIALFAFYLMIFYFEFFIKNNKKLDNLRIFSLFLPLNFLIFSSYNYFLNLLHYGHPLYNQAAKLGHEFWGGLEGYISNLINYFFQAFDFTGFKWGFYINDKFMSLKETFFNSIGIDSYVGTNVPMSKVNIRADEQTIGYGVLGFLVYLPVIFISLIRILFGNAKRIKIIFGFAFAFIINILVLSLSIAYMVFSIRFILAFICLSACTLVCVYRKKSLFKPVIIFFIFFYMTFLPYCNDRMPFLYIVDKLKADGFNLEKFINHCYEKKVTYVLGLSGGIHKHINEEFNQAKKIAYIKTISTSALYLKIRQKDGYKIDFISPRLANKKRLNEYDLVVLDSSVQNDNTFGINEIDVKYEISDNQVKFKSTNSEYPDCYYTDIFGEIVANPFEMTEVCCFTKSLMDKNSEFKLVKEYNFEQKDNKIDVYYYLNKKLVNLLDTKGKKI